MSEYINNNEQKLNLLKEKIKKIDSANDTEAVKEELKTLLNEVSYEDVVKVEQQLVEEGIDKDKMLELCDLHTAALRGLINPQSKKMETAGHPVHTLRKENQAIKRELEFIQSLVDQITNSEDTTDVSELFLKIRTGINNLMDVEKHYSRKENLLFPFLEKYNITGPSTVMWGKHDQIRGLLKNCVEVLKSTTEINAEDGKAVIEFVLTPATKLIDEMIYKEETILFPMALDSLSDEDWYQVYNQSDEIGFCLFAPTVEWKPENLSKDFVPEILDHSKIKLPTGIFNLNELNSVFNTMPFDLTFVDKDDNVKFFSHGSDRIFQRSNAILGRKVQYCHPPSSVHIVEKILSDFKSGNQNKASFWINFQGKFVYISYYALRDEENNYLGTLEVTQDLTELRKLEGERRILEY
jgi:DUF438 domain-containing protein